MEVKVVVVIVVVMFISIHISSQPQHCPVFIPLQTSLMHIGFPVNCKDSLGFPVNYKDSLGSPIRYACLPALRQTRERERARQASKHSFSLTSGSNRFIHTYANQCGCDVSKNKANLHCDKRERERAQRSSRPVPASLRCFNE